MSQQGQFLQEDFFDNVGGLNLSDSAFKVAAGQASQGRNYSYVQTGGIKKRDGHLLINTSPDTQLRTLGLGLHNTSAGVKTVIRAAGTKIQSFAVATPSFTSLSEDTAVSNSDFLTAGSTQQVIWNQFNTPSTNVLWGVGGGMGAIYGTTGTQVTKNGVAVPTGSFTATRSGAGGGAFISTGTYSYAIAFRKLSTQAISNAVLDVSATVTVVTDKVTINLAGITNPDTTKYDAIYIYRSAVAGGTSFTAGDLIARVAPGVTSYDDLGAYITTSTVIPRAGNAILDNSALADGAYKTCTVFKRRLVTALNSTVYLSDVNKPESWPILNTITIPTGGNITGLAIISFSTPYNNDEYLVIFKERELWIITGSSISDWALNFIDPVGCASQSLVVTANGFLTWLDYRGVYLWDGSGKPVYCSRLIEPLFGKDGDLDKSLISEGFGQFFRKESTVVWFLSSKLYGEQKFALKMDLRLSLPRLQTTMAGNIVEAVFIQDTVPMLTTASLSYLPSATSDEVFLLADSSGYCYKGFAASSDNGTGIPFEYVTNFMDQGSPSSAKRYHKVIVWVQEIGTWNLELDYWVGYRTSESDFTAQSLPVSSVDQSTVALWNVGYWDTAYWNDYTSRLVAITYNLRSDIKNNNEGDCLRLRFKQNGVDQPMSILGYSVVYSPKGLSK